MREFRVCLHLLLHLRSFEFLEKANLLLQLVLIQLQRIFQTFRLVDDFLKRKISVFARISKSLLESRCHSIEDKDFLMG